MRSTSLLWLSLALVACGGAPEEDAGVDAGMRDGGHDAGMDAGSPDAGADAGPSDAGTDAEPTDGGPPPVSELAMDVEGDLSGVEDALAAVPDAMQIDGAFLQVNVAASGIDALIGETGIMTLALSDATVRALADLRQANVLLALLTQARAALSDMVDPAVVTLHDRIGTLITTLTEYRGGVARLYRERLADGIVGTPVVSDPAYANTFVRTTGAPSSLAFVIEGQSATMESASFEIYCFGKDPIDLTVVRDDTGEVLLTQSGAGMVSGVVPVPFDTPTAVTATVSTIPSSGVWESCSASMTSRRSLRTDPVAIDTTPMGAFDMAMMAWQSAVANADTAHGDAIEGTISGTAHSAVRDQIQALMDLVAPFTASDSLPIPVETFEEVNRRLVYVSLMFDAMVASPALAGTDAAALRTALTDLKTAAEALMAAATP